MTIQLITVLSRRCRDIVVTVIGLLCRNCDEKNCYDSNDHDCISTNLLERRDRANNFDSSLTAQNSASRWP